MTWLFSENAKRVRAKIYEQFLSKGRCHGTSELLEETGLSPLELTLAIKELERGLMVMCPAGTHDVAKCPPWSNVPTRHRVEKDGVPICYAGCMLEALNMAYCYPGADVTIRTSCPQSGQEIRIVLNGNEQIEISPPTVVGHVGVDPANWSKNWFHSCAHNNFFASAEAVRLWESTRPEHVGVILTMDQLKQFARYDYRLDLDRGADPDEARTAQTVFGGFDVVTPSLWQMS